MYFVKKKRTIENINAIGTVKNNATYFDITPFDFEVDKLGISNLDLKPCLEFCHAGKNYEK